ncbi:hypothetical protein ACWCXX_01040 [Streptomyces sp. NPDC001732]
MRPVRPVTGAAASAVTIAALGLFVAGPTAYAGDTEALRTGSANAVSRTVDRPMAQPADEEGSDDAVAGPGADAQFGLDALSGLGVPSLLDSAGGLDALSGLGLPGGHDKASGDEEDGGGGEEKTDQGGKGDKGDEESGGRDSSSSSGRESWKPSGEEDPAKHDGSSSGHDSSSSEHEGSSTTPTGPTGHVRTGVGGSVRSDTTQIAAGAGVLAVTAVGGAWLLRRRASGTQGAC